MSERELLRSEGLLLADRSVLLAIDLQERLIPVIADGELILWNVGRLIEAANLLEVPHLATEQYPEKLGQTVEPIRQLTAQRKAKRMFSCREQVAAIVDACGGQPDQLVVCGIETHVCVLQTVLDLAQLWDVHVVVDAIGSRKRIDHDVALLRMQAAGCHLATTESVIFQWCETSTHPRFKSVSKLVRPTEPPT